MSHYRKAYQCMYCGKVYRTLLRPELHGRCRGDCFRFEICGECGAINRIEPVSARPRLFGLRGWEVNAHKTAPTDDYNGSRRRR